ncbi:MAG: hypothetical protein HY534_01080 [Chloroflexi bacterium]|nr:hypothetical protein [Chloroflexota bacterium]
MLRNQARLSLLTIGFVVLTACAPSPSTGSGAQPGAPAPEREKTITAMIQREPGSFDTEITQDRGGARAGGVQHVGAIVDVALTRTDDFGQREGMLATTVPTQANGMVKLNPDGSMEVTWKLRPDIYWHDGPPVTTADYVFRERVIAELQIVGTRPPVAMLGVTPIDEKTMMVKWAGPYINYDTGGIANLPKHILGDLYERDKEALPLSRYFRGEFVGTGPFKLVEWADGSHMEFRRNEQYHLGVPKVHRIFLRFVPDSNTMVANLLSGAVEVAIPEGIDMEKAIELKQRWDQEGAGHSVKSYITTALYYLEIMVDPQYARPIKGMPVKEVRQGVYHGLDRPALNQALHGDLGMVADSQYAPNDKYYPMVKDVMPQFPYDPRRAQQLLEQAGWTRGPEGILVHPPSGPMQGSPYQLPATGEERFDLHLMLFPGAQHFKLGAIIQANWKDIGVNTTLESLTPANQSDVSYTSRRSGLFTSNPGGSAFYTSRLHSRSIPLETNRWSGSNRGRYSNPEMDQLLEKLAVSLDPAEQQELHRRNLELTIGEAMMYPLFWESVPMISLKGIKGPKIIGSSATQNIHEWDRE